MTPEPDDRDRAGGAHGRRGPSGRRVDEQLRRATSEGAFRNLPGAGRPLPQGPLDENWWIRGKLRREGIPADALLPTSLRLRKEVEDLPATVRALRSEAAVRTAATDLARRVRDYTLVPTPPHVVVPRVDVDAVVARWHAERPAPPPRPPDPAPPAPRRRRWFTGRRR